MPTARYTSVLLLFVLISGFAGAQQRNSVDAALHGKRSKRSKPAVLKPEDGLAVISAALDARTRRPAKTDCSHLVHEIYERAGFGYEYASSSELYAGTDAFRRVKRPQPGDLVVWPGHVGIVVNPAQRSFYSVLSSGLGVDAYDSPYWKERGRPRFLRYLIGAQATEHASNARTSF
jgi:NlpC/P60 family